jgi:hypothetical protein
MWLGNRLTGLVGTGGRQGAIAREDIVEIRRTAVVDNIIGRC